MERNTSVAKLCVTSVGHVGMSSCLQNPMQVGDQTLISDTTRNCLLSNNIETTRIVV